MKLRFVARRLHRGQHNRREAGGDPAVQDPRIPVVGDLLRSAHGGKRALPSAGPQARARLSGRRSSCLTILNAFSTLNKKDGASTQLVTVWTPLGGEYSGTCPTRTFGMSALRFATTVARRFEERHPPLPGTHGSSEPGRTGRG